MVETIGQKVLNPLKWVEKHAQPQPVPEITGFIRFGIWLPMVETIGASFIIKALPPSAFLLREIPFRHVLVQVNRAAFGWGDTAYLFVGRDI